ncbi:MAG TPA: L-threonylcarbamoyladenylate synthase [Candidatus Aminicenantes bacterium]|nr:L-threonylcarbamoyladenylate synthase [Candidatus Aminicenantes bacterium]
MSATRVIRLRPAGESVPEAGEIAAALRAGAVAAYPTETFYALGAAAFGRRAVERVYRLKGRAPGKPLPVIASGLDMVREISGPPPPGFLALAGELWPGPLTLVLPAAPGMPGFLAGPGRTIAVRVPPLAWLRGLLRELGEPLTATSANLSGERELSDPREVEAVFAGRIELLVDGGPAPGGLPSTIVDLSGDRPRVLREGRIAGARIEALLGR